MSQYLIDTDWIIQVLHGDQAATTRLEDLAEHGLAISLITYGELYEGSYYAKAPQLALAALDDFLIDKEIVPLSQAVIERFAILRGQLPRIVRQQVGDMDLLIAATAMEHGLTLLTLNVRDFQLVPGLSLYQRPPATSSNSSPET